MSLTCPIKKGRRGAKSLFGYNNDCLSTHLQPTGAGEKTGMSSETMDGYPKPKGVARAQRPAKRISPTTSERSGPAVVTVIDSDPPAVQGPEDG